MRTIRYHAVARTANGRIGQLIVTREPGRLLARSEQTLRHWRVQGRGPRYRRVNRRVLYVRSEVLAYRDRFTVETAGRPR